MNMLRKCNQEKKTWCEGMELALTENTDDKGLIVASMLKFKRLKGKKLEFDTHLSPVQRPSYRTAKGKKGKLMHLNCCPWCQAQFNMDLRE